MTIAALAFNDGTVKLLMTTPELDYFAASLILAEIRDISCFSNDNRQDGPVWLQV
jgi:hypothetical protein